MSEQDQTEEKKGGSVVIPGVVAIGAGVAGKKLVYNKAANELAAASNASGDHSAQSLPMWNDDDMMDIMPVTIAPDADAGAPHWAEQARNDTAPSANSEAAAQILEALAKRVREGELLIPGHTASMGDAATLAGVLAALLGARQ